MKRKIALLMTMIVVMVSVCGLSTLSAFAVTGTVAKIVWIDNSDEAGRRPQTIEVADSKGSSFTINTSGSDTQTQVLSLSSTATFPDVANYTKTETTDFSMYDESTGMETYTYTCTYTYSPPTTEISIPIQLTMPAAAEEATDIDVTVPEKISFVADDNGDFSSDFTVENKSSSMAVDTILSATPYGEWKIVPGTTNFASMGANQKKFSLLAEESTASNIDLSDSTYTFNIAKSGSQKITLKGKTGPVTDNVVQERCVTVSLYITQAS